jgi:hypothetical protein
MKRFFLLILALLFGVATPAARAGSAFAINDSVSVPPSSTVSTLAGLALSGGTLSPSFDPGTTDYTATMTSATTTLTPTLSDSTATVAVNGIPVASGAESAVIPLTPGDNTLTTVVTAQDGSTTASYTVR